ncbi:GNAT family N-acetyltransferase [Halomonas nitroreducens]|uniref:N-acetyltransferase n=1 Tax=Halomonas nitroreducens TaxID=447425 RepID=A0A3S0HVT2_9GAMM|nr:N-acetyltransferase [Halomonas nitroreducens]RTR06553.1 N-acetyltransferase [Halomonas nitroreducens]
MNRIIRPETASDAPAIMPLVALVALVAEEDGVLVGHVALSPMPLLAGSHGWYGMGPLAVIPSRQGQGIGSRLVEAALAKLRELGARGCMLVGEPRDSGRFGFRPMPSLVLPGVPTEVFQALSFQEAVPQARVSSHAACDVQY